MGFSYTKVATHDKCNAKYNYRYNLNVPVKPIESKNRDRGTNTHKEIENYLHKRVPQIPEEFNEFYGQFFMALQAVPDIKIEEPFGLDREFAPCAFDDPNYYIRGFMDLRIGNTIYEWKTGRVYPEHENQRLLYGLAALLSNPAFDHVKVISVYLDRKENVERTYLKNLITNYKWVWRGLIEKVEKDDMFIPMPSNLCVYCEYSRNNGGPCKF